jgi:hypothetical protein
MTLGVLALCAASTSAQIIVDDFSGGANQGGWTYGPPDVVEPVGGNPGGWLHQPLVDTFAPQLRTTGASGFLGDWRGQGVNGFSFDLISVAVQFPFEREATLMLTRGATTVYRLGTEFVPQPGTGWKSFNIDVPSESTTLPAGWTLQGGGNGNAAWNTVIADVTEVRIFYGNPEFFFIFDQWNVGADNLTLDAGVSPWVDLGNGLGGTHGVPLLELSGPLTGGSVVDVSLTNALENRTAFFVLGFSLLNAPLKGGILVPALDVLVPVPTDGAGSVAFAFIWPAGVPAGTTSWYQSWISDAAGPVGFAASNGVSGTTP